jgi:hypothetical protein
MFFQEETKKNQAVGEELAVEESEKKVTPPEAHVALSLSLFFLLSSFFSLSLSVFISSLLPSRLIHLTGKRKMT